MLIVNIFQEVSSWVKMIVFALLMFILITIFLFQPYTVNGNSMEPTFTGTELQLNQKGDFILVLKSAYKFSNTPKNGDIVVIDSRIFYERTLKDEVKEHPFLSFLLSETTTPKNYKWIKRVIGEAGDTIEIKEGKVIRNGTPLVEPYILEKMEGEYEKITVPDNHVFVLGDNRNHSGDSRVIGPIPYDNIIGKVFIRYYPFPDLELY